MKAELEAPGSVGESALTTTLPKDTRAAFFPLLHLNYPSESINAMLARLPARSLRLRVPPPVAARLQLTPSALHIAQAPNARSLPAVLPPSLSHSRRSFSIDVSRKAPGGPGGLGGMRMGPMGGGMEKGEALKQFVSSTLRFARSLLLSKADDCCPHNQRVST